MKFDVSAIGLVDRLHASSTCLGYGRRLLLLAVVKPVDEAHDEKCQPQAESNPLGIRKKVSVDSESKMCGTALLGMKCGRLIDRSIRAAPRGLQGARSRVSSS